MTAASESTGYLSFESRLKAMLMVEEALARALAQSGVISEEQATAVAEACQADSYDADVLERKGAKAGTPVIPLVRALIANAHSISESASRFVHLGATSQDILDTATVLQLKNAISRISDCLVCIESTFASRVKDNANTPVLGRTLLQAGPPISFGLKLAGWAAAARRARIRIEQAARTSLCLQFGGAVGNLSSLGSAGMDVAQNLANELDLPLPQAPWHTHRDALVNLASSAGILVGSLGKIARDISLHTQGEIAELREPSVSGKGGSSAMPHKRNPVGCMRILAAANRSPALVSSLLSAMPQEHERGLGGWQSEWPSLRDLFSLALEASSEMAEIAQGLEIDSERMRANLDTTNEVVFSERLSTALLPRFGRIEAQERVAELVRQSIEQNRKLSLVAAEDPEVRSVLDSEALDSVFNVFEALGFSSVFIDRLLDAAET